MSFATDAAARFSNEGLPTLERYTAIECLSPTFDADWAERGAIDAAAELLAGWIGRRSIPGLEVEIVRLPGHTPVILAEVGATAGSSKGTTLIYGHFDKQPPLGAWREGLSAFTAVREGDRLYGRGTADDGYSTFAALSAVEALAAGGVEHGRIIVLIEGSEESGSPDLADYLDHLADRLGTPALVICLDSGCVTYDRLWVTTSLRGVIAGDLTVEVLHEGVHSGHAGGIVPSSFRIARRLLSRIEDEASGAVLLPELQSRIPEHRVSEIAAVAAEIGPDAAGVFPVVGGLELIGSSVAERIENGTWRPALAVTGQAGMPDLGVAGNVLRPFTSLKLSVRLPPNVDATVAAEALERALTTDPPERATVSFTNVVAGDGWDSPAMEPWLDAAVRRASEEHFGRAPSSLGLGGSIPFMASLGVRYPGTQFLATGVLGPESNAHGPNEFLHVPTAERVTACVAEVLSRVP